MVNNDTIKFEVLGVKNVIDKLNNSKKIYEEDLEKAMQQIALFETKNVKQSIAGQKEEDPSVDTGKFLNSVGYEYNETGARVYSNVEYAKFLEYGTTKFKERRHFRNTLARDRPKIV